MEQLPVVPIVQQVMTYLVKQVTMQAICQTCFNQPAVNTLLPIAGAVSRVLQCTI